MRSIKLIDRWHNEQQQNQCFIYVYASGNNRLALPLSNMVECWREKNDIEKYHEYRLSDSAAFGRVSHGFYI